MMKRMKRLSYFFVLTGLFVFVAQSMAETVPVQKELKTILKPKPKPGMMEQWATPRKLPDLWPEILNYPGNNTDDPEPKDALDFRVRVSNVGDAWTPEPADIKVELYRVNHNGVAYPSSLVTKILHVPAFRNGGQQFLPFTLKLKEQVPGKHHLKMTVNYNRKFPEKDMNNNEAMKSFMVKE
jgi:hypothetical protein